MSQGTPSPKNKPPKFIQKRDFIIIGIILALAAGIFAFYALTKSMGNTVKITIGLTTQDQIVETYSLDKNQIIEFESQGIPVQLEIKNGKIRFIHSQCPDHNCETFGWLQNEGDWAACIPASVVIHVNQKS